MVDIPKVLIEQVRDGNIVLLLGAGASKGAVHPEGRSPPDGVQLARQIAEKFLDPAFLDRPLDQVAALAISETDATTVQDFIAALYRDFQPAEFHALLPSFRWAAIATTNYDLLVERAYARPNGLQELVPFTKNGEHVEKKLRSSASLMYLKLHGCITKTGDAEIPLILTPEQYITHKAHRSRLFERLSSMAHEYPLVVVGHSLGDVDIRAILLDLAGIQDRMPRSYLVAPHITDTEIRYWSTRKFTTLKCTFEEFLRKLDSDIPGIARTLSTRLETSDHPLGKRLQLPPGSPLPKHVSDFLRADADYVHGSMPSDASQPKLFYKGHFQGWPEIQSNLDVKRSITDTILSEIVLPSEPERKVSQELVVIRGHAGSGKTVTLRRVAWEAATELEALCLFSRSIGPLNYEAIRAIFQLAKRRVFLFVNDASEHRDSILYAMTSAVREHLPLTIIATERTNEWSAHCGSLDPYVTKFYSMSYLNENEIDALIALLERHRSLGHLEALSPAERHDALSEKAGRNLLVALHEATLGKPFSDIIFDEYSSIPDARAKALYRTVCILHRLHVSVRAGLISRVHGIPFTQFSESLFKPLENVVFAKRPEGAMDYFYRSRHPHIADMVFERCLLDSKDRLDEYLRIISCLDVDYDSDRAGLKGLTRAKELESLFTDVEMVRAIYAAAKERDPGNAALFQQEALHEMRAGSLESAYELLQRALRLQPNNFTIQHTLAELSLRRSQVATHALEKRKYRTEAKNLASSLLKKGTRDSYPYHTILKATLWELEESVNLADDALFSDSLREFERILADAKQRHPGDSFILDQEAKFAELLNNHPHAIASLRKAFTTNKRSAYVAARLAGLLEATGDLSEARSVLKEGIEHNARDKELHFRYAMLLDESDQKNHAAMIHHLRTSFVEGDSRYASQFWYARAQFLHGDRALGEATFRSLRDSDTPYRERAASRGRVMNQRFYGAISKIEQNFGFVVRDGDAASVFVRSGDCPPEEWLELRRGSRVQFSLCFNYLGPLAAELRRE